MFKKIMLVLVFGVGLFAGYVAIQPSEFKISRSLLMSASPQIIFDEVNDFHKWEAWSPWAKLDPTATFSYEGPSSGTTAAHLWSGNNEVGEGKQTIVESIPYEKIRIKLDFSKPMKATNMAEFTFVPQDGQTLVTWSMEGKNNFIGRAMCVFMNMDKMVGGQFEKGLLALKTVAQTVMAETK